MAKAKIGLFKLTLNLHKRALGPKMQTAQIIHDFSVLGNEFLKASQPQHEELTPESELSEDSGLAIEIENCAHYNPWFIPSFTRFAYAAWADALKEEKVAKWIGKYSLQNITDKHPVSVGIILAGNIPMVGLHDLLCVLASGNHAMVRLSSSDDHLIPAVLDALTGIDAGLKSHYSLVQGPLKNFDAIIATGNNNSSRYFDYYFGRYPHIIRKNRNGVAIITGNETDEELKKLASDIFMYFGMGCRNVSKLYMPEGLGIEEIMPFFEEYSFLADHHKYRNNYDYQKSILLINRIRHRDNGFLLAREEPSLMSPISVIHTETYNSIDLLKKQLYQIRDQVQCIISCNKMVNGAIHPGRSQFPELWDYADGTDTMEFLMTL
jgi:hypothetical protein